MTVRRSANLAVAVEGMPGAAEVRLHAAIVLHGLGQIEGAEAELAEAVKLDSSLEKTLAVERLRAQLGPTSNTEER